jgi:GTP-binding nuclear protein Ran
MSSSNYFRPINVKLIVVGYAASGKTSIVNGFKDEGFRNNGFTEKYIATTGFNSEVLTINFAAGSDIKFFITDFGGKYTVDGIKDPQGDEDGDGEKVLEYYENADAAIIVFDVTNMKSFTAVESKYKDIRKKCPSIPIILCGNKVDLSSSRVVSENDIKNYIRDENEDFAGYIETSAKSGLNLKKPLRLINKIITDPDRIIEKKDTIVKSDRKMKMEMEEEDEKEEMRRKRRDMERKKNETDNDMGEEGDEGDD